MASTSFEALKEYIDNLWVVDTHEHLTLERDWLQAEDGYVDFSRFFTHYASVDIISAGLPDHGKFMDKDTPLDEKWAMFEPYWERAKNTAYCKAVDTAIRDLFDLPGLNRDTYRSLTDKMREMHKPGYYKWVLKDKAKIERSVIDILAGRDDVDPEFFATVTRLDHFIMAQNRPELQSLERETLISIHSLDDLTEALQKSFEQRLKNGAVAVKSGLAYVRTLYYEYPSKPEAEKSFAKLFKPRGMEENDCMPTFAAGDGKPLQDYMFHKIVQLCVEHDLPMQIHTGIQEGNGNYLRQSNPVLLNHVFMTYPKARFDLFHAGYPYWAELGVMAKMFPGVHADLCWTNVISPAASKRALDEWLEVMPASKIFAFGGDYIFVEGSYAHAKFARQNVTKVLADKVDDGYFTLDEAKNVANMILRENANEFFKLGL